MVARATTGTRTEGLRGLSELAARGWTVISSPPGPTDPVCIGHVAVGPTGAFALDVRDWPGQVTVRNDLLRENDRSRDHLVRETVAVVAGLATALPIDLRAQVRPVLVLARDEPLELTAGTLLVCSTGSLVRALTQRETVWSPDHVEFVTALLRARIDPDGAPEVPRARPRRGIAAVPAQRSGPPDHLARAGDRASGQPRRQSLPLGSVANRVRAAFRPRS